MHAAEIPNLQSYNGATPMLQQIWILTHYTLTVMSKRPSPGPTLPCIQSCASAARAFLTEGTTTPSVAAFRRTTGMDKHSYQDLDTDSAAAPYKVQSLARRPMGPVSPDLDPQTFMMPSVKVWLMSWRCLW